MLKSLDSKNEYVEKILGNNSKKKKTHKNWVKKKSKWWGKDCWTFRKMLKSLDSKNEYVEEISENYWKEKKTHENWIKIKIEMVEKKLLNVNKNVKKSRLEK